jgi:hypothetical protein
MRTLVCILVLTSCAATASAAAPLDTTSQLRLGVAVVLDAETPLIRFTAANFGSTPVPEINFSQHRNGIVVLLPTGAIALSHYDVDPAIIDGEIAPGATHTWDFPFAQLPIIADEMRGTGEYRLYWYYAEVKSNEIRFIRSKGVQSSPPQQSDHDHAAQSPTSAVLALCHAMDGDPAYRPLRIEHAGVNQELAAKAEGAVLGRWFAVTDFRNRVDRRFGKGEGRQLEIEATAGNLQMLSTAPLDYGPYFSEVTVRAERPIRLVRRSEERDWELAASNFIKDGAVNPGIAQGTDLILSAGSDVTDGKFATAADAVAAVEKQMREKSLRLIDLVGG